MEGRHDRLICQVPDGGLETVFRTHLNARKAEGIKQSSWRTFVLGTFSQQSAGSDPAACNQVALDRQSEYCIMAQWWSSMSSWLDVSDGQYYQEP